MSTFSHRDQAASRNASDGRDAFESHRSGLQQLLVRLWVRVGGRSGASPGKGGGWMALKSRETSRVKIDELTMIAPEVRTQSVGTFVGTPDGPR